MNHLPELCSDFKSSTRSVLDVLQNMSSKGIHPKDENDFTRYGSRGLGGDMPVDGAEISRPLFVQKPKANIVCTKDSTTQTL